MRLILASASPRRAELLTSAGFEFDLRPAEVDETPRDNEPGREYVLRVAQDKATAAAARRHLEDAPLLAADTIVLVEGRLLGKPDGSEDAARMLRSLSGKVHDVLTAVVLLADGGRLSEIVSTRVCFASLSDAEIRWYIETGEPMGKAGGYAIQGLGSRFVESIEGSWSNVVGLPIAAVYRLLKRTGRDILS